MDNRRKLLGSRIRDARIRLSYTQEDLAREAALSSSQIVSQIEKGEREVKAWELFNLARALMLEISQLLTTEESELAVPVLWREAPSRDKEIIEAEFLKRCRQYALVERLCSCVFEKQLPAKSGNLNSMGFREAATLGEQVWEELDLGNRPACALSPMLEDDYGVKIWYKNLGEEGSAASTFGPFGAGILVNSQEAPWRRNFSIAHELFHLITWKDMENSEPDIKTEKLANAFASALLLPKKPLREAFAPRIRKGEVENGDLIAVARQFDVSTQALCYRLINLGWADHDEMEATLADPDFKSLDYTSKMGKWLEPPTIPERFVRLAFLAYQRGNLSRPRLAEYLNVSISELGDRLQEYGLNENIDYQAEVRAT